MSKRMISMGSIDAFRTIVKNIQWQAQYTGEMGEDGNLIMNKDAKAPTVTATYSEKSHGSNAAWVYTKDEQWAQSRKNIITIEKDNAGCAFMMEARKDILNEMCISLANENDIDLDKKGIALFMEICGGNIQKNACFTGTDKMFTIFQHAKVFNLEVVLDDEGQEESNYWIETKVNGSFIDSTDDRIWNMMNLNSGTLEIDFERPDLAQNTMIKMVEDSEKNSPAGNKLGLENTILEGFVFTFMDKRGNLNRWKIKGNLHSKGTGKVKTLKPVDSVFEQKKIDFVNDFACVSWRLEQAIQEVCDTINGGTPNIKQTGDVIRWVINDNIKENSDIMIELGIEPKMINSMISKVARPYFLDYLDKECGI